MKLSSSGFLAIPMALLLSLIVGCALGLVGLLSSWNQHVELQLRLDRCVQGLAIELRESQNRIEQLNSRIRIARGAAAIALASGQGEALAALQKTVSVLVSLQEEVIIRWSVRQALAALNRSCPLDPIHSVEFMTPLPWHRPLADPLGPMPLEWRPFDSKGTSRELRIHLAAQGVRTHASVTQSPKNKWRASFQLQP